MNTRFEFESNFRPGPHAYLFYLVIIESSWMYFELKMSSIRLD